MSAGKKTINIEQGADFNFPFAIKDGTSGEPIDINGCSLQAQLRKIAGGPLVIAFNTEIVDAENGRARIYLSDGDTGSLVLDPSQFAERKITSWCYDINITFADESVARILEGVAQISPVVTKDDAP